MPVRHGMTGHCLQTSLFVGLVEEQGNRAEAMYAGVSARAISKRLQSFYKVSSCMIQACSSLRVQRVDCRRSGKTSSCT